MAIYAMFPGGGSGGGTPEQGGSLVPTNPTIVLSSYDNEIQVNWAPSSVSDVPIANYIVYWRVSTSKPTTVKDFSKSVKVSGSTTEYSITGLSNGSTIWVCVCSVGTNGIMNASLRYATSMEAGMPAAYMHWTGYVGAGGFTYTYVIFKLQSDKNHNVTYTELNEGSSNNSNQSADYSLFFSKAYGQQRLVYNTKRLYFIDSYSNMSSVKNGLTIARIDNGSMNMVYTVNIDASFYKNSEIRSLKYGHIYAINFGGEYVIPMFATVDNGVTQRIILMDVKNKPSVNKILMYNWPTTQAANNSMQKRIYQFENTFIMYYPGYSTWTQVFDYDYSKGTTLVERNISNTTKRNLYTILSSNYCFVRNRRLYGFNSYSIKYIDEWGNLITVCDMTVNSGYQVDNLGVHETSYGFVIYGRYWSKVGNNVPSNGTLNIVLVKDDNTVISRYVSNSSNFMGMIKPSFTNVKDAILYSPTTTDRNNSIYMNLGTDAPDLNSLHTINIGKLPFQDYTYNGSYVKDSYWSRDGCTNTEPLCVDYE